LLDEHRCEPATDHPAKQKGRDIVLYHLKDPSFVHEITLAMSFGLVEARLAIL